MAAWGGINIVTKLGVVFFFFWSWWPLQLLLCGVADGATGAEGRGWGVHHGDQLGDSDGGVFGPTGTKRWRWIRASCQKCVGNAERLKLDLRTCLDRDATSAAILLASSFGFSRFTLHVRFLRKRRGCRHQGPTHLPDFGAVVPRREEDVPWNAARSPPGARNALKTSLKAQGMSSLFVLVRFCLEFHALARHAKEPRPLT